MAGETHELEALFSPPLGEFGTHALVCGLSADVQVLERLTAAFTGETPGERGAAGLVRTVLMLDASSPRVPPGSVPGLLHLVPCLAQEWRRRTTLLHAKVALLGFGSNKCSRTRRWRLIVSTGNWTSATWGSQSQIDFAWATEWVEGAGGSAPQKQARADVAEAFDFFSRVMESLFGTHVEHLRAQPMGLQWLREWQAALRKPRAAAPQFVHSLERPLMDQVEKRCGQREIARLVVGSGFFEEGRIEAGNADETSHAQPLVLKRLESLCKPAQRHVVFNRGCAGALASWIGQARVAGEASLAEGRIGKWHLRQPVDPLASRGTSGRGMLHAKYVAGLKMSHRENDQHRVLSFLYLGSGNLSRRGMLCAARLSGDATAARKLGNVEAGVVLLPGEKLANTWKALACGDYFKPKELAQVQAGEPGRVDFTPVDPPPVLFAQHSGSRMQFVRSESTVGFEVLDALGKWVKVTATTSGIPWNAEEVPAMLAIRFRSPDAGGSASPTQCEVPVFSAEGLYARRVISRLSVADVLQALHAFPAAPPYAAEQDEPGEDDDGEGDDGDAEDGKNGSGQPARVADRKYPLRTLAAVIESIALRNAAITRQEMPYWLAQMRVLLVQQANEAELDSIRAVGVDLWDALRNPGFVPPWLYEEPRLAERYEETLAAIREHWTGPLAGDGRAT